MTNEKMLTYANELKTSEYVNTDGIAFLNKLIAELEADIRKTEAKKTNKTDIFKTCNAIIKYAKKDRKHIIALHGAWVDNGYQFVSDSYRIIRMKTHIPLETIKPNCTPINAKEFFKIANEYSEEIEIPSVAELKEFITIEKTRGNKTPKYDLGENKPLVNAKFLLEIAQGGNFKYYIIPNNLNIIYFTNADKTIDGFICCIRK